MLKRLVAASVAAVCVAGGSAFAQERATLIMSDGQRIRAELVDMSNYGFDIRVNGQERTVPVEDVASIIFATGRAPGDAQSRIDSGEPVVVLRDGQALDGRLTDIVSNRGVTRLVFDTPRGTRQLNASQVAQVHFGYSDNRTVGTSGWGRWGQAADPWDRSTDASESVVVPANTPWTDTGIIVARGERVQFEADGNIMVSDQVGADPSGASIPPGGRLPVASARVGALVARIGNGAPFLIGANSSPIRMPVNGRLFLGVNDEHFPDNSGSFSVRIIRQDRQ